MNSSVNRLALNLADLAPALSDHLWQSTLFLLAAALLTLVLRRNPARTRHALWLAASLKFLVPFSLLVSLGSHLTMPRATPAPHPSVYTAIEGISQPFTLAFGPALEAQSIRTPTPLTHRLPLLLAALWLCGTLAVLLRWFILWRRIAAAIRASFPATPSTAARELDLLRRMECAAGLPTRIRLLRSPSTLGPGIYGILRPALIWPEAISHRLSDAHLQAILAHEIAHVRRRDNLAAALHMLVEAFFWFHPLVWLLGLRLAAERERACDEAVLADTSTLATQPHIYAESILKVCEFYAEPPLPCVSGITRADLKHRITAILERHATLKLSFPRKLLLLASIILLLAVPIVLGMSRAQSPASLALGDWAKAADGPMHFDVASIRLNKLGIPPTGPPPMTNVDLDPGDIYAPTGGILRLQNKSLRTLIAFAYKMNGDQQLYLKEHVPDFVLTDRFDLEARTENTAVTKDQFRLMMQSLLTERFKLAVHKQTIQATVLGLTPIHVGKLGPRIRPHQPDDPICKTNILTQTDRTKWINPTDGYPSVCGSIMGVPVPAERRSPEHQILAIGGRNVPMRLIAEALVAPYTGDTGLAHPVIDTTGLTGTFDFTLELEYTEMEATFTPNTAPAFFEELTDQLGLKLQSQKGPEDVYIVDHAERLSANDAQVSTPPSIPVRPSNTILPTATFQPVAFTQAPPQQTEQLTPMPKDADPTFEVASIRPSDPNDTHLGFHLRGHRIFIENVTVENMITFAYSLHPRQVVDAPAWISTAKYDIDGVPDVAGQPSRTQYAHMVQKLLADRFGLTFHRDQRTLSIYAVTLAKGGAKLANAADPASIPDQNGDGHGSQQSMRFTNTTIDDFILGTQYFLDRPSVNQTGLTGHYDFTLRWSGGDTPPTDPSAPPGFFTAIQEQIGLKLEPTRGLANVLVIDHIEKPSEN